MNIQLNTRGVIINSKDKEYISNNIYVETIEGSNFCYIITSDEFGCGDEMTELKYLEETFKERGWIIKWEKTD